MDWVIEAITKYTGVTDRAELEEIYDVMAGAVRTFNGLDSVDFKREAMLAKAVVDYERSPEGQAEKAAYMAWLETLETAA